jgi:hypothetical protein
LSRHPSLTTSEITLGPFDHTGRERNFYHQYYYFDLKLTQTSESITQQRFIPPIRPKKLISRRLHMKKSSSHLRSMRMLKCLRATITLVTDYIAEAFLTTHVACIVLVYICTSDTQNAPRITKPTVGLQQ